MDKPLQLDLVQNDGSIFQSATLTECFGILSGFINLPSMPVQYQLNGVDIGGTSFSHIIPNSFVTFNTPKLEMSLVESPVAVLNKGSRSIVRLQIGNANGGPQNLHVYLNASAPRGVQILYSSGREFTLISSKKMHEISLPFLIDETFMAGDKFVWSLNATDSCTNNPLSMSFEGLIKPSVDINAVNVTSSSLGLQWIPPSSTFLGNVINYALTIDFTNGTVIRKLLNSTRTRLYISGLSAYQLVYASIIANTDNGQSAESTISVQTNETRQ